MFVFCCGLLSSVTLALQEDTWEPEENVFRDVSCRSFWCWILFTFLSDCMICTSAIARLSQLARQAIQEWKEKAKSMKKSKVRASGSIVPSSSTSQPAQPPVPVGLDLSREASDPLSAVRTPSASSTAACNHHQSSRSNSETETIIVRRSRSCKSKSFCTQS